MIVFDGVAVIVEKFDDDIVDVAQPDEVSDTDAENEFDDVAELVAACDNDALPLVDTVDDTDALDVEEDSPTKANKKTQHINWRT